MRTFHRWGDLLFIMDDHDNPSVPPEPLAKLGVGKGCIAYDIEFLLIYRNLLIDIVSLN